MVGYYYNGGSCTGNQSLRLSPPPPIRPYLFREPKAAQDESKH